jgi:hypothetical protein
MSHRTCFAQPLPRRLRLMASALALCLLAACAHVPLPSLPALAAIDFETTQFSALRAAVDMPATIRPLPGGVRLDLRLTIEGEVAEERSYVLAQQEAASLETDLPQAEPGRHAFVYALEPEDQRGMEAIRQAVETAKARDQRGSLVVNVSVRALCTTAALPEGPLLVDVFLLTSETGRFIRTLDGFDIRQVAGETLPEQLPAC